MPATYRVRITPRAVADLEGIHDYVSQDSPESAAGVVRTLVDAIDSLARLPHRFSVPRVGPAKDRNVRSMPVRPYLVRYRIDDVRLVVFILRIRHGARKRP